MIDTPACFAPWISTYSSGRPTRIDCCATAADAAVATSRSISGRMRAGVDRGMAFDLTTLSVSGRLAIEAQGYGENGPTILGFSGAPLHRHWPIS